MKVINLSTLEAFYHDGTKDSLNGLLNFMNGKVNVKYADNNQTLWYTIPIEYDGGEIEESEQFGYNIATVGYFVWDARNQDLYRYEKKEFLDNFIEVKL